MRPTHDLPRYRSLRRAGAAASDAFTVLRAERMFGGAYRLPAGYTWAAVAAIRAKWNTPRNLLPLACQGGAVAWGFPMPSSLHRLEA